MRTTLPVIDASLNRKLTGHNSCVNALAFSPGDGRWLASAGDGKSSFLPQLLYQRIHKQTIRLSYGICTKMTWLRHLARLVVPWSVLDAQSLRQLLISYKSNVFTVAFSSSNQYVYSCALCLDIERCCVDVVSAAVQMIQFSSMI